MGSNLTSDLLELLLGILRLVGVIYICASIMTAYFYLANPPSTDLEKIEEGASKFEMEEKMKVGGIEKMNGIVHAENFEKGEQLENVEDFEEVDSFEDQSQNSGGVRNSADFKKFDDDDEMIKGRRLWEETYAPLPVRAKDDDWEIV